MNARTYLGSSYGTRAVRVFGTALSIAVSYDSGHSLDCASGYHEDEEVYIDLYITNTGLQLNGKLILFFMEFVFGYVKLVQ